MRIWIWAAATMTVAAATGLAPATEPNLPLFRFGPLAQREAASPPEARSVAHSATVRTTAWRQDKPVPPPVTAPAPMPVISGHGGIGQGTGGAPIGSGVVANGAVIAQTAWNHEHVYTGYVYGPGSCDYTPPCTDHLWDGYCQRPHRCGGHCGLFHHYRGCGYGGGCSTCGVASSCDYGCGGGCGHFGGFHGFRLHGRHCNSCSTSCDSCTSTCADACGCGRGHRLFGKCGGWFGGLCSACDGGMSCGCAAPISAPSGEVVPAPMPDSPMTEGGNSARAPLLNRYLPWSIR